MLPWHEHGLGLQWPQGSCLNTQLHIQGPRTFPKQSTQQTTASTIPTRQAQLQSKSAVHGRYGHIGFAPQRRQEIHSRGHRHIPILYVMCQQHHACGTGVYCYTTSKPNREHDEKCTTILGL